MKNIIMFFQALEKIRKKIIRHKSYSLKIIFLRYLSEKKINVRKYINFLMFKFLKVYSIYIKSYSNIAFIFFVD